MISPSANPNARTNRSHSIRHQEILIWVLSRGDSAQEWAGAQLLVVWRRVPPMSETPSRYLMESQDESAVYWASDITGRWVLVLVFSRIAVQGTGGTHGGFIRRYVGMQMMGEHIASGLWLKLIARGGVRRTRQFDMITESVVWRCCALKSRGTYIAVQWLDISGRYGPPRHGAQSTRNFAEGENTKNRSARRHDRLCSK
ncbi:hypothetical protein DFH09DRAFT_505058 [Mycena vulgaris]|nr:hypothetical protein DFH09DRAFT_505058 [Mycena vulgaris]